MAVLAAGFVFSGGLDRLFNSSEPTILQVGDIKFKARAFFREWTAFEALNKAPGQTLTPKMRATLLSHFIHKKRNEAVVEQEAQRLDLRISDARIAEIVQKKPEFLKEDGTFDSERFDTVVRKVYGTTPALYMKKIWLEAMQAVFAEAIAAQTVVPSVYEQALEALFFDQRAGEYLSFSWDSFGSQIVSEEHVARAFGILNLKTKERRTFSVLVLPFDAPALQDEDDEEDRKPVDIPQAVQDKARLVDEALKKAGNDMQKIEEAAKHLGVGYGRYEGVALEDPFGTSAELMNPLPWSLMVQTAFKTKKDAQSGWQVSVFENGLFLVHVEAVEEARPMTLEEARPQVVEAIERAQKSEAARKRAQEIVEKINAGEPLPEGLEWKPIAPLMSFEIENMQSDVSKAALQALFQPQKEGVLQTTQDENGSYIVRMTSSKRGFSNDEKSTESLRTQVQKVAQSSIETKMSQAFFSALGVKYDITLNRPLLHALLSYGGEAIEPEVEMDPEF